jgi:hypothetical protein
MPAPRGEEQEVADLGIVFQDQKPLHSVGHHSSHLVDCLVYGVYFVDRREVASPDSPKAIRQDYFVVFPRTQGMRYYSGEKKSWRKTGHPIHWRDIVTFCDDFAGPGGAPGIGAVATTL